MASPITPPAVHAPGTHRRHENEQALPDLKEAVAELGTASACERATMRLAEGSEPRSGRILLVEDTLVNQVVIARLLAKMGYVVDVAIHGQAALDALDHATYDLILMDGAMPEMDGFAATAAIRARPDARRHTPIIALTASAFAHERERCLAAGMNDHLAKPVTAATLQATLNRWGASHAHHVVVADMRRPCDQLDSPPNRECAPFADRMTP